MIRRGRLATATLGFALILALAIACTGQQEATPTKAPSGATTPVQAPAATPTPKVKTGGILKIAVDREELNRDPHIDTMGSTAPISYSKLVRRDIDNKLVGDTAEKWEVSPDGKVTTFYLRKGVKFWNMPPVNGREVTCEDWVYSLKRIASPAPEFQGKDLVDGITGYECPDKYTLKILSDPPFAALVNNLTRYLQMAVVPKELVDQEGDLREKFIGTGPFMLKEWIKGQVVHYVKNPDYFIKGVPYLDGIDGILIADKAARTAALRTKQVDFIYSAGLTPKDKETIEKSNPEITWVSTVAGVDSIRMNVTKPPFNDWRVRYAINLAIDRKKLIQLGVFGGARITGNIDPVWGELALPMDQLLALPGYRYPKDQDIAEAKKLMAEAGYANGIKTTSWNWEYTWDYAAPVKDELAKIGIEVDMQNVPLSVWKPKMLNKDYEMAMGNTTVKADVDGMLYGQFHPKGGFNESGFNDPEMSKLFEQIRQTPDPAKRANLTREAELKLQKITPWVPIAHRMEYLAFQSYVKGIDKNELNIPRYFNYTYMPYLWLDK